MLEISCTQLNSLEIRQNKLIKQAIRIGKYCKTTPLIQCLKLDSIRNIYLKHKIYFSKQIKCNDLTNNIYSFLNKFYSKKISAPIHSFCKQLDFVNKRIKCMDCTIDLEKSIQHINNLNSVNQGLNDTINFIIFNFTLNRQYDLMIYHLKELLNYKHYDNS